MNVAPASSTGRRPVNNGFEATIATRMSLP
jgi:hypothetical protein